MNIWSSNTIRPNETPTSAGVKNELDQSPPGTGNDVDIANSQQGEGIIDESRQNRGIDIGSRPNRNHLFLWIYRQLTDRVMCR